MKELHDGTLVDDSVPTKCINGKRYQLTAEEIQAIADDELARKDKEDLVAFKEARQEAYGPIEDQLDYIVHNGLDAYIARNKQIKEDIVKPE